MKHVSPNGFWRRFKGGFVHGGAELFAIAGFSVGLFFDLAYGRLSMAVADLVAIPVITGYYIMRRAEDGRRRMLSYRHVQRQPPRETSPSS